MFKIFSQTDNQTIDVSPGINRIASSAMNAVKTCEGPSQPLPSIIPSPNRIPGQHISELRLFINMVVLF
jgi:hypothetical protein